MKILCIRAYIYHTDFKSLGILNIKSRAEQFRLNHVFNICNDTCPDCMNENFFKGTLDICNTMHHPQLFSKKVGIFISLEVLARVITEC